MATTPTPARKRLGDLLKEKKRVTETDIARLLEASPNPEGRLLGDLLLESGLVPKEELVRALEEITGCSYLDARFAPLDRTALTSIPHATAFRCTALPLQKEGRRLVVVMAEPQNLRYLDELRTVSRLEITLRLGLRSEIITAVEKYYGRRQKDAELAAAALGGGELPLDFVDAALADSLQFYRVSSSERSKAAIEEFAADVRNERTPAVKLTSAILAAAISKNASDLHIEPHAASTVVRIRVDGVLRELTRVPSSLTHALISRIKILADMDIAERRVPQDGRLLVQCGGRNLDLRVSTLPVHEGEKVVMRLLDPAASRVCFTDLGFSSEHAAALNNILGMPQGMVLVTGPTGSGKSTTLYSAINQLCSPEVNIITVEDPVEYKVEEINQVQVNPKAGLTFAGCLRSILRQDPNVIMVGEVRDSETAEIALQAAQTGHLVLSTLHTNDSVAAVTRLLDLNVPGFLIASSVTAVIAQRLVRKLCSCRKEIPIPADVAARLAAASIVNSENRIHASVGCAACDGIGYKGRLGIYEVLLLSAPIRAAVRLAARDDELRALARSGGMRTMQEDALLKVSLGLTTMQEIMRVVPFEDEQALRCDGCGKTLFSSFGFCPHCSTANGRASDPPRIPVGEAKVPPAAIRRYVV